LATALGLALGRQLGTVAEERAALWAGIVLVLTGVTFAGLKYFALGI
jgi:putative Mn2+ efflux pump MntP